MFRAKVLYHVTSTDNINSILSEGLRPKYNFIHLSQYPNSWKTDDSILIEVNIEGLDSVVMTYFPVTDTDEVLVWNYTVEPSRLKVSKADV